MKKTLIILLCGIFITKLSAQTLSINLPQKASAPFVLTAKKGLKADTLAKEMLDASGRYTFATPANSLPGIWVLSLDAQEQAEFVWTTKENPVITNKNNTLNILQSPANDSLRTWGEQKMMLDGKLNLCRAGQQLYATEKSKQQFFITENRNVERQATTLDKQLERSSAYAARYLHFISMEQKFTQLLTAPQQDKKSCTPFYNYFKDSIDVAELYTSGRWFNMINLALELYRKGDNNKKQGLYRDDFTMDMIYLLARTEQPEVFTALGNDLLLICGQFGWDQQRNDLLNYLVNSKRVQQPTPLMKKLYEAKVFKIGEQAPPITLSNGKNFSSLPADKYLVMFFESGCGHCEHELAELKKHYEEIKAKNIAIITVSADKDKMVYETTSNTFPWERVCDFKGTDGPTFKSYGVTGTPTIFLIGKEGKIQGSYATIAQAVPLGE